MVGPPWPPARDHPRRCPHRHRATARPAASDDPGRRPVAVRLGKEEWRRLPRPGQPLQGRPDRACHLPASPARPDRPGGRGGYHPARPGLCSSGSRARSPARADPRPPAQRRRPGQPPADHRRADPAAGRPHLPGSARLAHQPAGTLAQYRQPHLLISRRSAPATGPVSHAWLRSLRGLPATLDRLRIDRQVEEALTHGADPLHLAVVFALDDTTASATPPRPGNSWHGLTRPAPLYPPPR